MQPVSVVIITKNEAIHIAACIRQASMVSSDIIVVDSGSTDDTVSIATQAGARIIQVDWVNFGHSRNTGAKAALHPWILAIDADERISPSLAESILQVTQLNEQKIYGFRRENYFSNKKIRFGTWGRDKVFRLYHQQYCYWNNVPVHESLQSDHAVKTLLSGTMLHYPAANASAFHEKISRYAPLVAGRYYQDGKKIFPFLYYLAPIFAFMQSYFLFLGFLDGKEGYTIARLLQQYTALKYRHLLQLRRMGPGLHMVN